MGPAGYQRKRQRGNHLSLSLSLLLLEAVLIKCERVDEDGQDGGNFRRRTDERGNYGGQPGRQPRGTGNYERGMGQQQSYQASQNKFKENLWKLGSHEVRRNLFKSASLSKLLLICGEHSSTGIRSDRRDPSTGTRDRILVLQRETFSIPRFQSCVRLPPFLTLLPYPPPHSHSPLYSQRFRTPSQTTPLRFTPSPPLAQISNTSRLPRIPYLFRPNSFFLPSLFPSRSWSSRQTNRFKRSTSQNSFI